MEGLGLVDYGSDQDDDVRSSDSYDHLGSSGVREAAAAVHELEHLDPAATMGAGSIALPTASASVTSQGLFATEISGEDGKGHVGDSTGRINLEVAPPGLVAAPLQDAVNKYLKMRRDLGVEVKAVIGMSRDFRNPYFLQKWVHDAKINEGGSSMPPECFDPLSLHEEDFYEKLQKAWEAKKTAQEERKMATGGSSKSGAVPRVALHSKKGDVRTVVDNSRAKAQQLGSRWPK